MRSSPLDPLSSGADVRRGTDVVDPPDRGDLEPVADGGRPSTAGIAPASASALSSFLDEHGDAPGFELTYTDDGTKRTRLLHRASLHAVTLERPSAAPALQCTPVSPRADQFTVRVDAIERLSVVDPPTELYTAGAETPAERASGLRRLAGSNPEAVRLSSLLAVLDREDENALRERDALEALRRVSAARPADCAPAIPVLRSLLTQEEPAAPAAALATLRAIGESDPGDVAPLADEIVPYLQSELASARREAARCIAAVAEDYPGDAVDAVPTLATLVEDEVDGQTYAVYALSRITAEYPEAVKPAAETLGAVLLDGSISDSARLNAAAGLGRVVGEYPSVAVDIVDDVAALFDAADHRLRNNAVALIGDVAIVHTDAVEPYAEELTELLTVDDTYTRVNASGALSRVAEDFPESVEAATPTFVELLSDESPLVRENACWALGHLRARAAKSDLETRVRNDESADVRTRASWALDRIEE